MAAFPSYTVTDLSGFSGRAVAEYTNTAYIPSAISQASLLFKLGTCLGEQWPDDPTMAELARMAVLSMADAIYIVQPFQQVLANPFSSETIGSYSYSKVAGAVMGGLPTGISWFDFAMSKLSVCELDGIPIGGGIEAFEFDGVFANGAQPGNVRLLGPSDLNSHKAFLHDPSGGYAGMSTGFFGGSSGDDDMDILDGGEI